MSTLNVSNITDGTTTVGTSYVVNGSAKAWVNFNGTGTIAARDSFNVASLTDNGTGDYTVNFSSAMANSSYALPLSNRRYTAAVSDTASNDNVCAPDNLATSSAKVVSFSISGRAAIDSAFVHPVIHGDLA